MMSVDSPPITDAEILATIVASEQSAITPELARFFPGLRVSAEQIRRMHELADKNNLGTLTDVEDSQMESYARVGSFLSLLQSKSRLSLAGPLPGT
jgi:hypothetical protein